MGPHKIDVKDLQSDDDLQRSSSSSNESESESRSNVDESSEESDSLDSSASRKRRKVSPQQDHTPFIPTTNAPSRIKKKVADDGGVSNVSQPVILAPVDSNTTFDSLGLSPWLVKSLNSMAIKRPTGIQKGCIPEILKGRDCIGGSRTGSGKTVAFAGPIIQKCADERTAIYALILTPTRELALQIYEQVKAISSPQGLKAMLVIGGGDMRQQALDLARRPHIVISTPGRLADHIEMSVPDDDLRKGLSRVKMVVFDEADQLLAPSERGSMVPDIQTCLSVLPPKERRQTLLFTATMTEEVRRLQHNVPPPGKLPPFVCEVDTQVLAVPPSLKQMYLPLNVAHRESFLHTFLLTPINVERSIIIFCNRTATADYLTHLLRLLEHRVTSLHSKLKQPQRTANLGRFRVKAARILVATDVAARGLDIPEVDLVLNYDVPRDPDQYIHRVGRTARAGRKGDSVTIIGQRDVDLLKAIEARTGKEMVEWKEEGVNLETRLLRDGILKLVGEKKLEALVEIEEGREVGGKRKRGMVSAKKTK